MKTFSVFLSIALIAITIESRRAKFILVKVDDDFRKSNGDELRQAIGKFNHILHRILKSKLNVDDE